ncbi:hypothetical protein [Rickettsia endosymbiont of Pantilius tunicatus]|uniref:hypothetical protein n=1 Tax=Rickettsia endosymbiont of Pantilius tunicatus TaxID=3066267 RepID=UPI0030E3F8B9
MNSIRNNFLGVGKNIDINLKNIFRQVNETTEIFNTFLIDKNFTDEWDDEDDFDYGVWIEVPLIELKEI